MEPVTHVLTGACLARAGFNRKAAYATLTMAIAAEFPDIDTLWSLRGPVQGFTHHRGITHTFLGIPFEAALLVGLAYGLHRWREARAAQSSPKKPLTKAPVRWGWLFLFAVFALLSHIFLDYTNNYGVRPFFPFNPHWYAASIVFIFDPLLFLLLLLALLAPALSRLISAEIGARRQTFRGRGAAITVLTLIACYYGFRAFAHGRAVTLGQAESVAEPQRDSGGATADQPVGPLPEQKTVYLQPQRVLASPDPLNPLRWYMAMDFGNFYQLGTADLHADSVILDDPAFWKQPSSPLLRAAFAGPLGRAYLDWSPMPIITLDRPSQIGPDPTTLITLQDPRFMGDTLLLRTSGHSPLTAFITVDSTNTVLHETLDGSAPSDSNAVR